jgi:hypothetical protein
MCNIFAPVSKCVDDIEIKAVESALNLLTSKLLLIYLEIIVTISIPLS